MNRLILTAICVTSVGCVTQTGYDFKPLPPESLLERNLVEKAPVVNPEELKKGPVQTGRVINYKGHGLGYDSHAGHHRHMQHVHGHGGLGYHND